MLLLLIAVPLLGAGIALVMGSESRRPWVVLAGGLAHLGLLAGALAAGERTMADGWIGLDPLGTLVLGVLSVLFVLCALYGIAYLRFRNERPNRTFCSCLLAFLAMATLVCLSQHLGLLWVSIEATTLATGVLIYFNRNARSLEATWKYLLIGSVGIALALLGTLFLSYAAFLGDRDASLLFEPLLRGAATYSRPWIRAGFVFLLVGYGTKMGLAPLHSWKPDAYGEAPGLAGALMAGGMTSCAFLALLRGYRIVIAAGEGPFARQLFLALGMLSMALAAVFMARQRDFKRMLAYSSVEHMGILALGVGIGGAGVAGAFLHTINNALTKAVLFLAAGNVNRAFGSKSTDEVRGAIGRAPLSGWLFLLGFLAVTGSPPFGPFVSELTIVSAAISQGHLALALAIVLLLAVVFIGMGATVLGVVQGEAPASAFLTRHREEVLMTAPPLAALGLVAVLGLWIPAPLWDLVTSAAAMFEAGS